MNDQFGLVLHLRIPWASMCLSKDIAAMVEIIESWKESLGNNDFNGVLYMDLLKAFDGWHTTF